MLNTRRPFVFVVLTLGVCLWVAAVGIRASAADLPKARSLTPAGIAGADYVALAVGASTEEVNGMHSAGAVNVIYARSDGLESSDNQFWHQDSAEGVSPTLM